jgi:hypothetical protein
LGGLLEPRALVGADGSFEVRNVIPGSYNVVAMQQTANQRFSAQTRIEVANTDVEGVSLTLRPGVAITGQVYIDGQTTPPQFRMEQLRVILSPAESEGMGNFNAAVKADGTFVLNDVAPMTYRVNVNGIGGGGYLLAARLGGADALADLLRVGEPAALALQVGFSPGRIEGTVTDGRDQPYSGVNCALVPSMRTRVELYRSAATDQFGRCTFANVVPGDYKVFAWEDIPQGAYMDPAYISRFEDRGAPARVEKAGSAAVKVRVIPAG